MDAHRAHRDAVGEDADVVEGDAPAGLQRLVHRVRLERLDADDADVGQHRLDVAGDAGEQAAAADRDEHRVQRFPLPVADDLVADGALPGDDQRVVERVDEGESGFGDQVIAVGLRVRVAVADEDDLGAARLHRLHLDRRRRARHDDDRAQPELLRRAGDALGVVAGAGRDHAAGAFDGVEVGDLVVGAADLEAEDGLEVLALEVHAVAQSCRQPWRELERRLAGDVVDAAGEDPPEQRVEKRRP